MKEQILSFKSVLLIRRESSKKKKKKKKKKKQDVINVVFLCKEFVKLRMGGTP